MLGRIEGGCRRNANKALQMSEKIFDRIFVEWRITFVLELDMTHFYFEFRRHLVLPIGRH